jgi:hypothetical protein
MLLNWQHDGSPGKSNKDLDTLVHNILLHPDFDLRELKSFNVAHENQKYDAKEQTHLLSFQHTDIKIDVPSGSSLVAPRSFTIPGLYYQSIIGIERRNLREALPSEFDGRKEGQIRNGSAISIDNERVEHEAQQWDG